MAIEQTLREEWHSLASTQASNETELLTLENVRGLGIGYKFTNGQRTNQPSLLAFVNQKINVESGLLANKDKIPPDIDGVPTDVLGVGEVFAGGNGAGIDIGGIVGNYRSFASADDQLWEETALDISSSALGQSVPVATTRLRSRVFHCGTTS